MLFQPQTDFCEDFARNRRHADITDSDRLKNDCFRSGMFVQSECSISVGFCSDWKILFVKLGKKLGLYKDERAPKNCTPNYLPEFIRIEVAKREE